MARSILLMRNSEAISTGRFTDVWCAVPKVILGWELDDLNEPCVAAVVLCRAERAVSWSGSGAM
jgi:hypothetical protein